MSGESPTRPALGSPISTGAELSSVRKRSPKAFTLLEAMISGALLLIAIAGLMSSFSSVAGFFEHQRLMTPALGIAESEMETLLLLFPGSDDLKDIPHPEKYFNSKGEQTLVPSTFTMKWTSQSTSYGMRRIRVIVEWKEGTEQRPVSIVLETDRT